MRELPPERKKGGTKVVAIDHTTQGKFYRAKPHGGYKVMRQIHCVSKL